MARLAIQCARWLVTLDAPCTHRYRFSSENINQFIDYTDCELALELMSSQLSVPVKESTSGFAYTNFKKSLLDFDSNLKRNQIDIESQQEDKRLNYFLQKFGINSLDNKNYEIHHIKGAKTHYIENGHNKTYYDDILAKLENNDERLLNELDHIVMLPGWFHRYCTSKHIEFNNRKDYYQALKNVLMKLKDSLENEIKFEEKQEQRRNDGKKPLKERRKLLCDIKCLGFNEKSIDNAIRSIKNLASVTGNDRYIIDCLRKCYEYLRQQIINNVININI